jgi:hypothetical protein
MGGMEQEKNTKCSVIWSALWLPHFELKVWNLIEYLVNYEHQSIASLFLKDLVPITTTRIKLNCD